MELLIVVALFSVLGVAVFSTFASGMRIWARIQDASFAKRKVLLVLEKMSIELRQCLDISQIGFSAENSEISFPTLTPQDKIIKVSYSFAQDNIYRASEDFEDILDEAEEKDTQVRVVLLDVEDFDFSFAYLEEGKLRYSWKDTWEAKEGIPKIVKIDLTVNEETFSKTIRIPIS
mgnify:CR=1 FL=1